MTRCSRPKVRIIPSVVSWATLIIFSSIFLGSSSVYLCNKYSPGIIVYEVIVLFFVILFFSLTTWTDPGIYPKASESEIKSSDSRAPLYKNIDIHGIAIRMKWCQTCKFYRPPRSSHCSVCNSCIEIFDHHCPWVNNCVGRRNYRFFYYFLFTLSIHVLNVIGFSLLHIISTSSQFNTTNNILLVLCIIISTILFIPIFGLTVFHTILISRGRTTNEQVTGKFKGAPNPYNLGCLTNCLNTFFKSPWPKLSEWNSKEIDENMKLINIGNANGNGLVYIDKQKSNGFNKSLEFDKTFSSLAGDTMSRTSLHNRTHDSDSSNRLLLPPTSSAISISGTAAMELHPNEFSKNPAIMNVRNIDGTSSGRSITGMSMLAFHSNRSYNQNKDSNSDKTIIPKVGLQSSGSYHSLSGISALGSPSWGGESFEQGSTYSINSKLETSMNKRIEPRMHSQRRKKRALSTEREKALRQDDVIVAPIATEDILSPSSMYCEDNGVFYGLQNLNVLSNDQAYPILQPLNSPKRTKFKNKLKEEKLIDITQKSIGLVSLKNEPARGVLRSEYAASYQPRNEQPGVDSNKKK